MTPLGIVMLVHTSLGRAAQVARFWAEGGCPVVIHVDRRVRRAAYDQIVDDLKDLPIVEFSKRHACEWGTWGIVQATQDAATQVLRRYPEVRHVFLASGACLPIRPVADLAAYLAQFPRTDFIESAAVSDAPWTVGGLDAERFTLHFPFSWRKRRRIFDAYVSLQRVLRVRRDIPKGLVPHLGSQWWCLTRRTLSAILQDPNRAAYDRYFRKVWIPDESYFQTLARLWASDIQSRSLTLSKFDHQGKPHVFYDDHLNLLRRSDRFVARKIWPRADRLYEVFLRPGPERGKPADRAPAKIDRVFARAAERRLRGRRGVVMQSRFPNKTADRPLTATRYSVFQGFAEVFPDFQDWMAHMSGARVHGHLFAPERVQFAGGARGMTGALTDQATVRDANPRAFLSNLIWNTRGERQGFLFGPSDQQKILSSLIRDSNAEIAVITGAWAVPLFLTNANFGDLRRRAAELQKIEDAQLKLLQSPDCQARVRVWSLADWAEAPMEPLQAVLQDMGVPVGRFMADVPATVDLTGFGQFLQNLKNQGMHPYLIGDIGADFTPAGPPNARRRPYLVKK